MGKSVSTDDKSRDGYFVGGQGFVAPELAPGLYIVATPIGNLRDITLRALEVLASADVILCEDTRTSAKLLDHFGIKGARGALHEHNEAARIPGILEKLAEGQRIALISDAGTPLLSDPGFPLVRAAREAGHKIFAIPGPSALLAALTIAGLPTDRFGFFGFLPSKSGARGKALQALADRSETLVFYESPRRLGATLAAMAEAFGETREAAVALELTKKFERVQHGTLAELTEAFSDSTKGEAVIVVAGAEDIGPSDDEWQVALEQELQAQPLRGAVDTVTQRFSLKRKQVYDAALALKAEKR